MVVHNLNLKRIGVNPAEADAPLVVDPNAVLARAITREGLQTIAWNRSQVRQGRCRVNLVKLPLRHWSNTLELPAELAPEDFLGLLVPERPNHNSIVLPFRV